MYYVRSGAVELRHGDSPLRVMRRGEYFGEMSMLIDTPRTAGAVCVEKDTELVVISRGNFNTILRENLLRSVRLWEACAAAPVRRVIFVSSGGTVYGNARTLPIREDDPTDPVCAYGLSKLAAEKYLGLFRRLRTLDSIILRPGNAYGPGQNPSRGQSAATVFAFRALRREPITIWGDGSATRDLLYVDDLVDAIVRVLAHDPGADGPRVFNVGTGHGTSVNELLATIGRVMGQAPQVSYAPGRGTDVRANVLDASRLRTRTGWEPRVSLAEGIRRMLHAWGDAAATSDRGRG